jgi:DNA-binding MarR family transcriptional regulator
LWDTVLGVTDDLALGRQVCFALYSASRATTAAYRMLLADLGLTYPQYLVLLVLWEQDGLGVREICDALDLDTGTLSPLLKRLEAMGLIERRRSATDERRVHIFLTDQGTALRSRATAVPTALAAASGLTEHQLTDLHDTLTRLHTSLQSFTEGNEIR